MRADSSLTLNAIALLVALPSPLLAKDGWDQSPDRVDSWAERALADFERDEGWSQRCHDEWSGGRFSHCEVREFSYPRTRHPLAVDGGQNGGMTVTGWNRDQVRILYRVRTRARSEERARALAAEIQLESRNGWLRPEGPSEMSRRESWSIEIKAWVPRASDLALRTHNGPLGVRGVRGTMDLSSQNGPVSLVDLAGAVEARVQNGPLHVALEGSRWDGPGLDAEAQNGPLNLSLSSRYSARLVTGTINGPRSIDYAIGAKRRGGWISTTLGEGGAPVRVVTNNGPFHIGER